MLWPYAGLRRPRNVEIQTRVADARRRHPESEAWLGLLEAALAESEEGGAWEAAVPPGPVADRPVKAPLLYRTHIAVDERAARRWVTRLAARANVGRVDAVALLEAGVRQESPDPPALRVVAQMAAVPLLHACARVLGPAVPDSWWEGYCPLCGAWPVLAEYIGLERKRRLRCGRCGTGWAIPMLRCIFCDETDHEQLGYLAPEGDEEMRKVEVCNSCKGYVKALTTVRSLAPWAILLDDLATVHLDLVAIERGYERPERPGYALEARVA
jgi:FdhE protein